MALAKTVETDVGVSATYFRIVNAQTYYVDKVVDVVFGGYIDETARRGGKRFIAPVQERFTFAELGLQSAADPEVTRAALYAAAKQRPSFDGATDA